MKNIKDYLNAQNKVPLNESNSCGWDGAPVNETNDSARARGIGNTANESNTCGWDGNPVNETNDSGEGVGNTVNEKFTNDYAICDTKDMLKGFGVRGTRYSENAKNEIKQNIKKGIWKFGKRGMCFEPPAGFIGNPGVFSSMYQRFFTDNPLLILISGSGGNVYMIVDAEKSIGDYMEMYSYETNVDYKGRTSKDNGVPKFWAKEFAKYDSGSSLEIFMTGIYKTS